MTRRAALLPCPFCGARPHTPEHISGGIAVECGECGVSVVLPSGDDMSRVASFPRAIEAWNRRAPQPKDAIREAQR